MSLLKTGDFDDLMNEQDNEGNTALHLAALHGHVGILKMLAKHKTVDNGTINNLAMTAVDIIQSSTELNKYNKVVMTSILELKGAQPSMERRIFGKKRISQLGPEMSFQSTELQVQVAAKHGPSRITSNEKNQYLAAAIVDQELELEHSNHSSRQTKNLAQVNLIVATIIASITFAAAITMPGGYKDNTGIPILNEKPHFRYFLAFNSLAFGLSASSMSIHFIFPLCSKILGDINYSYPSALLVFLADCSIFSSVLAFVATTNAVLREKGISLPANIALCSFYIPIVFFGIQIVGIWGSRSATFTHFASPKTWDEIACQTGLQK
ncbi:hypothetical protein TIFTF001_008216 [Ficus carica]|uniref:PGG domain-containing protein n=1 Tax=Ficus carica TaxID=3494 RepID=A0AA87ZS37_FICCA|nr:hypothetical protein TIFTF001_008216 [Ficus carica]